MSSKASSIAGTNKTFIPVRKTNNQIISCHTRFLVNKFNLAVDEENKRLPHIYWNPKLRKSPSKARFIIAAPQFSVNLVSIAVTLVLKLMYKQIESYNFEIYYVSGFKSFWKVQNK